MLEKKIGYIVNVRQHRYSLRNIHLDGTLILWNLWLLHVFQSSRPKRPKYFLFFGKNSIKRDEPRRTLCAFLTYCPHVKWRPWTLTATLPLQAVATKAKESRRCQETKTICLGKISRLEPTWRQNMGINGTDGFNFDCRVEKYRPEKLEDLVSHEDITSTSEYDSRWELYRFSLCIDPPESVETFIDANRLPHLLFYGPPGTGKTSTILACSRKLYGPNYKSMVLEVSRWIGRLWSFIRYKILYSTTAA